MSGEKSPVHKSVSICDMEVWNDSCSVEELRYALEHGGSGATTNPVIVRNVLKKEFGFWEKRIKSLIQTMPEDTEVDIAWKLIEEMAVTGSKELLPLFQSCEGKKGRISIQTNAQYYRNAEAMIKQALYFDTLAPNMQIKMPATAAGIKAFEEVTYRGVNINATVCFTVPQALAVAGAVEKGLKRREKEGLDTSGMTPVCTIMVGRLDDWLKVQAGKNNIIVNPEYLEMAGVAAFKKAYGIYKKNGYRTRLLVAAYRNHYHWSKLIGDDIVQTIPCGWQKRFNASDVPVKVSIHDTVDRGMIRSLKKHFPDFVKAYEEKGMEPEEFDSYGATVRTLRGFIEGYQDLVGIIRDLMIPNPDV